MNIVSEKTIQWTNKWALSLVKNVARVEQLQMFVGSWFQEEGAATENERSARWRLERGTMKSPREVDRRRGHNNITRGWHDEPAAISGARGGICLGRRQGFVSLRVILVVKEWVLWKANAVAFHATNGRTSPPSFSVQLRNYKFIISQTTALWITQ